MKLMFNFSVCLSVILLLFGCNDDSAQCDDYKGYKKVYDNKAGMIVLQKESPLIVDPFGTEKITAEKALKMLSDYQAPLIAAKDVTTSRYVDFYFPHVIDYINQVTQNLGHTDFSRVAMRFYFAKDSNNRTTVILGPVKVKNPPPGHNQQVDPIWLTNASNFSMLDFASLCPDNCSYIADDSTKDYTGYER